MDTNVNVESRTNGNESSSYSLTIFGNRLRCIRRLIPVDFKKEMIELSTLAGPVVMAQLMVFLVSFVSTVFCGHLGKTELAGVALAIAVINVTGISIGAGLSSACDTLISQTFGSRNLLKVGVILQRAILIQLLACFPCWAILINTEPILLAVKQSPEVARLSQIYVKIFMPALPATFIYQLEARYLQNQGIIWPQVITGVVANLLNALINYIFLYVLGLGVAGSAWANTISQLSLAVMLYSYIIWKGLHKATWAGWSWECLEDWDTYVHLAIPSMIMLCVEWWTYEIGGFLAGLISEVELGAQSVVYELANICYMFPLGFSVAGSVRVGNALGAGDTEQAKLSAKLAMFCAGSVSVCLSVLVGILKDKISYVFTYDEQIRERVAQVMAFYAPFLLLDAISAASGSIIRGAGKQKVGAICNILGYYGVGFPIGVSLMFAAKLGIMGLWTGLFTCVFLQSSFLIFYLSRMNWKKATVEAQIRAEVQGNSTDMDMAPEAQSNDIAPCEGHTDRNALAEADGEVGDRVALSKVEALLAHRALVMRRGLALCVMLFILALGIIINLLLTNLT
ncbi:multidrug and toxin extrusion protein 1 isoform X1 [Oncorhynchus kisutch]|uniref:Multidrug and toxin extrusion protein n=1 Tax=Oncorhynchus kisutch TaxID=8019 RepID=A0A8C7KBC2_ONCKI|nr:multidrug and toxin extrusion protein 1-like isoform X1 [Oncorhynchus kisutch]XP_031646711.1 multidrug and toxin extrusion protein 1-like isoform X1 [Oncorhynchus kisutch]